MTDAGNPAVYKETLLFLTTAGLVVPIFHRLHVSPVLGFLAAGIALGPFGLGHLSATYPFLDAITITHLDTIAPIAEFGVVFLLFMIGLELSWERLSRLRRLVFGLGSLEVLLAGFSIGLVAHRLHVHATPALILGLALALSSTAIVIPVLAERKRLGSSAGRASFAVLLFQDLAVAPLLVMISLLSGSHEADVARSLLLALVPAAVVLFLLVVAGRMLLRPLFRLVAHARSTELFMATSLLVVIGTALIAASSGLSMGLGAFIAGLLLAETEFRREIEVLIEPFKGLLLGLFFVSVGASLDLGIVVHAPVLIVGLVLGLVALKACLVFGLGLAFRLPRPVALEVALLLAPGGEFAFVMIGAASAADLLPPSVAQPALVVVTLSMLLVPGLARLGEKLGRVPPAEAAAAAAAAEPPPEDGEARVIIAGFGRVGQLVGAMLTQHDVSYLAIDADPKIAASERANGRSAYFGNATRADFLRRCGIAQARALVVTMDNPKAVEDVVRVGRAERPDLIIVARARDTKHAVKLYELGVSDAVPETVEASLQMAEAVLVDVGVPMGFVIASIHEKRDAFRSLFAEASGSAAPTRRRTFAARRRLRQPAAKVDE
jgi:CPA2 family monovalent cation:H+ antiporter-2